MLDSSYDAVSENRELRSTLADTRTNLALLHSEMAQLRSEYEEKCHELNWYVRFVFRPLSIWAIRRHKELHIWQSVIAWLWYWGAYDQHKFLHTIWDQDIILKITATTIIIIFIGCHDYDLFHCYKRTKSDSHYTSFSYFCKLIKVTIKPDQQQ